MSKQYYIAQMNLVKVLAPLDDPRMADFVDQLDYINQLADDAAGFVWRYQDEHDVYDDDILLNMSVWESIEDLHAYVYQGEHLQVLKQGAKWADKIDGYSTVLWWIEKAQPFPTDYEAKARMDHLLTHGPSEYAFTFAKRFVAPDGIVTSETENA
ncbi:MAG: DUF3291 domain-containing protein [Gammaproteobacteria bacterium]|nr:DUF3291 domain-containing protein [Gammaproteobacteria bacterium]MDH5730492.1 DUF3291 domain-containing protein [Gammaproteobacteria bacterium]